MPRGDVKQRDAWPTLMVHSPPSPQPSPRPVACCCSVLFPWLVVTQMWPQFLLHSSSLSSATSAGHARSDLRMRISTMRSSWAVAELHPVCCMGHAGAGRMQGRCCRQRNRNGCPWLRTIWIKLHSTHLPAAAAVAEVAALAALAAASLATWHTLPLATRRT